MSALDDDLTDACLSAARQEATSHSPATVPAMPAAREFIGGVITGTLVGFLDNGSTPLVVFPDQPGNAALPARAVLDLHGAHIGGKVVLMFENGEARQPIIMGVLRMATQRTSAERPGHVEVDADGERMVVSASEQLVLKCGRASITLTKAGKVIIDGSYVSSRSSGVMRIKGGSVQLN